MAEFNSVSKSTSKPARPDLFGMGLRKGREHAGLMFSPSELPRFQPSTVIESTGTLQLADGRSYQFTAEALEDLGEIGRGNFGTVNKMVHQESNAEMAVKRIRSTVDEREQRQLLMDLEVVMKSSNCAYIVQFYGALFKEGDCWICMELMDISLDSLYKFVHHSSQGGYIPEEILGKVSVATCRALDYLKQHLAIIHRDVKPSNILLDRRGHIKLCDFGISGKLVDSIAKTQDAGCRPYMAPERIDPSTHLKGYDVRSDVWSLGITLVEVSLGRFPYPKWHSVFDQLAQVVNGPAPSLQADSRYSPQFVHFVNKCLTKEKDQRPKYKELLKQDFLLVSEQQPVAVDQYVQEQLQRFNEAGGLALIKPEPS